MKKLMLVAVSAALVLALWSQTSADPRTQRTQWEYKVLASIHTEHYAKSADYIRSQGMQVVESKKFLAALQAAGAEGWELSMAMKWDDLGWLYYFKRAK